MAKSTTTQQHQDRTQRIAILNDALRSNISNPQGYDRVVLTQGIGALIEDTPLRPFWFDQQTLLKIVRNYAEFSRKNDPYGLRDFGMFTFKNVRCFWKIDCYDPRLEHGSEDPSDPAQTARLLTIATMSEY